MKRQIKGIKVLSVAAILSAGICMTSFAEAGWAEENGGWAYYNDNGERLANQILEIDENYYYMNQDGVMVSNQWVSIDNENAGQEDEPQKFYYYFQGNGKAYTRSENTPSGLTRTKEIDGKKYAFDSEGRMLYGWVSEGERQTGDDAWQDSDYYFGQEDDGAMKDGWQKIKVYADLDDEIIPNDGIWEEEEQDRWFYFSSTGKKTKGTEDKMKKLTLHGQKYGFDQYGRMISSWYAPFTTIEGQKTGLDPVEADTKRQGGISYTNSFMYFGTPESGSRYTKGWFRARPSRYLMIAKHENEDTAMYYADGDGGLLAGGIFTIDGEKYAFDPYGRQITGFVCLLMEDGSASAKIKDVWYADKKDREFGTVEQFNDLLNYVEDKNTEDGILDTSFQHDFDNREKRFYYFYGQNGKMLTGSQKVKLGGMEEVEFEFEDSGRYKGSGLFGKKDGKLYKAGMVLKADEYQKYAVVRVETKTLEIASGTEGQSESFTVEALDIMDVNDFIKEEENVCNSGIYDEKKDETVWTVRNEKDNVEYYLVNQNGNIVKTKSRATDGDGYQVYVKNNKIKTVTAKH